MAFVFLASPGLSGRNEGSRNSHRSRLNNNSSFDDYTEDSIFKGNIYESSSCESYNEYPSPPSEYHRPVSFYISEEDEGYNENQRQKAPVTKKLISAYRPISGPTFILPPVLQWSEDTYNNNPTDLFKQEVSPTNFEIMTKDDTPYSSNCDNVDLSTSRLDETLSESSSIPIAEVQRFVEQKKYKQLKSLVRTANWGITHPIRNNIWISCLTMNEITCDLYTEDDYWAAVQKLFASRDVKHLNKTGVAKKYMEENFGDYLFYNYSLNADGIQACCRIIPIFLEMRTTISCCPMLYCIAALLLHYMEEVDAFRCLDRMVISEKNYFIKSKVDKSGVADALDTMARRHEKRAYNKLNRIQIRDRDELFVEWDKWIFGYLPFTILIRLMDCYFCEGIKVFYRTCITCFNYFMKDIIVNPTIGSALTTDGFVKAMELFLPGLKKSPKQFLNRCFRIRKFSWKEIDKIMTESSDQALEQEAIAAAANASTLSEEDEEDQPSFPAEVEEELARLSHTASVSEFQKIWKELPMRFQLCSPTLIFTTEEHGSSLKTMYRQAELVSPFLMLIKDQKDYVFGAYCSHPLSERLSKDEHKMRQTFFGNGETFVFSLKPVFQSYKWVGIRMQAENPNIRSVERTLQHFIHADPEEIMIGGGLDKAAIYFDKDMRRGRSIRCPTFDSRILASDTDFTVKVVEVYSITDI